MVRMAWRAARGLDKLLAQINAAAPGRNKASDGAIGDENHCPVGYDPFNPPSDHCKDEHEIVRARDFTHDLGHGADMHKISEALRLSRDRRIKYVIWNRRIFSATNNAWQWRSYSGSNPHTKHMHVSVVPTGVADDTSEWEIGDMPLTDDDVRRVAEASRDKTLGREWPITGQTLSGTVDAMKVWLRDQLIPAAAADETRDAALQNTVNSVVTALNAQREVLLTTINALAAAESGRDTDLAEEIEAIRALIQAGGGNVDTAALLAEIRSQATATNARVETLLLENEQLRAQLDAVPDAVADETHRRQAD